MAGVQLAGAAPAPLGVSVFARVPSPGQPEGIAVAPGGTVYVGTDAHPLPSRPDGTPPSKIFAFTPRGALLRSYVVRGQDRSPNSPYGVFGMALDGAGVIYAVDHAPPRIVALDPRTDAQSEYARFRDVPRCTPVLRTTDCSATSGDLAAFPNFPVFAPDGTMYVTDVFQALIWRVPRGGGRPSVWFTDPGLESIFGPNGAQMSADGRTLMFVVSFPSAPGPGARPAGLYALPVRPDGKPGALRLVWQAQTSDGLDGFQIARSGKIYVTAAANNQIVVLSPQGHEIARVPLTPQQNSAMEIPFDSPANVAFLGDHALITNHAYTMFNPAHRAVLDLFAGEPGVPFFRPGGPARLRLTVSPKRVRAGRRVRVRFLVTTLVAGRRLRVGHALLRFVGRHRRTDGRGRASFVLRFRATGPRRARASRRGYRSGIALIGVRPRR